MTDKDMLDIGFERFNFHGNPVWTEKRLKGRHADFSLCYKCAKLRTYDREQNCDMANTLYDFVRKNGGVAVRMYCPDFIMRD